MSAPLLFPSIDLRGGRVVRLRQGDYARETDYGRDATDVALEFCREGTSWIHIVDLDAAKSGDPLNRPMIAGIVAAVGAQASVQTGGGVRTFDDAAALADAGVARVVMGSAAVADPSLVDRVATRIPVAVGLDHRDGAVAIHGWTEDTDLRIERALGQFPAAAAFVITDIARDGLLAGPDVEGIRHAVQSTPTPVIASGGVASLDDVRALAAIDGLGGIIIGRAIYEGQLTIAEALAAVRAVAP